MMRIPQVCVVVTAIALSFVAARSAEAVPITLVNGDFETGTLAGWTTFTTANGNLGATPLPDVQSFDVDGVGGASLAARFEVGQNVFTNIVEAGGGIFQAFTSGAGTLSIDLDIAAFGNTNAAGGLFTLLLDGVSVDSFDFGNITGTERSTLNASPLVAAGTHEIRILMTRPYLNGAPTFGATPFQFVDDVVLDLAPLDAAAVPEPATLSLLGVGLAGAAVRRFRKRK